MSQLPIPGTEILIDPLDSDQWCTPEYLIDRCDVIVGGITLDPCSNPYSRIQAPERYDASTNGDRPWGKHRGLINGPYSDHAWWLRRSVESMRAGGHWIALVKLDPSTEWWLQNARLCRARADLDHRVKFLRAGRKATTAMFPSSLLLFSRSRYVRTRFRRTLADIADVWVR